MKTIPTSANLNPNSYIEIIIMKFLTFIVLTLFVNIAAAQEVTHRTHDKPSILYTNPSRFSAPLDTISPNEWISVVELTGNAFHKVKYLTNNGYILKTDIAYSMHEYKIDSIKTAIELDKAKQVFEKGKTKLDSINFYYEKFINSLCDNCLYISQNYDTKYNYTDFTFNINSRFKKSIKNITIYAQPYSPVNDKIGLPLKFKAVGPITLAEIATYTFENKLYSSIFSYSKITKVIVQFMDQSQITLNGTQVNYSKQSIDFLTKSLEFSK